MEGQKVGENSITSASNELAGNQHPAIQSTVAEQQLAPGTSGSRFNEELDLLWPTELIKERSFLRRQRPWSPALAIASLILATLIAIAVGPMQLILMVITEKYQFVTEQYAPVALRVALLLSGLLGIFVITAMLRAWKEQPPRSFMTAVAGASTIALGAIIWLDAFVLKLPANSLTVILGIAIILAWVLTILSAKRLYSFGHSIRALEIGFISIIVFGFIETGLTGFYMFSQTSDAEEAQIALEELGQAQAAARIDDISPELSDLVYTLCQGTYDPVYLLSDTTDNGIFECRDSHEVYSVSGPNEPVTSTSSTVIGSAFYFGKTYDPLIAEFFPAEIGAKYLYRDLSETENNSELVMLLPADSEEALIGNNLDRLLGLANSPARTDNLTINIFYTPELNTVAATRDFILIAAVDTITMLSWLPHGMNLQGYLNERYGAYVYTLDSRLYALNELAANPLIYSSQTRDALNARRHLSFTLEAGRQYTAEELSALLWASFVDPLQ